MSDLPRYGYREASALRLARHNRRKLLFWFRTAVLLVAAAVIIAVLVSTGVVTP